MARAVNDATLNKAGLDKFTIEDAKTSIDGISNEFSKYVGHIPSENRDGYIGALLGEILIKVKAPSHKWEQRNGYGS